MQLYPALLCPSLPLPALLHACCTTLSPASPPAWAALPPAPLGSPASPVVPSAPSSRPTVVAPASPCCSPPSPLNPALLNPILLPPLTGSAAARERSVTGAGMPLDPPLLPPCYVQLPGSGQLLVQGCHLTPLSSPLVMCSCQGAVSYWRRDAVTEAAPGGNGGGSGNHSSSTPTSERLTHTSHATTYVLTVSAMFTHSSHYVVDLCR